MAFFAHLGCPLEGGVLKEHKIASVSGHQTGESVHPSQETQLGFERLDSWGDELEFPGEWEDPSVK